MYKKMKYNKIYIGVLNNKTIEKIEQIPLVAKTHVVLFSNLNFLEITKNQLEKLRVHNLTIISTKNNIKHASLHKKSPAHALVVDWVLKQPTEVKFLLNNDSLLYIANKSNEWHEHYDGSQGYAVSCHDAGKDTEFYGHSVSITNSSDKLIMKEFDGFYLKNS